MPDMCDMVRPTWLGDEDDADGGAPLLADNEADVPDASVAADDDATTPDPATAPSLTLSLALRGVVDSRAVSESSTRSEGKSSSCCLSVTKQTKKLMMSLMS